MTQRKKIHCTFLQPVNSPWSKFTFIPTDSLLFRQIQFYSEELRKIKKKREIKRSISTEAFKKRLKKDGALPCSCVVQMRYMLIIVTQLNKASTPQLQVIYKQLSCIYLVESLSLLGRFVSCYLLVYLTRSKPTLNRVFIITFHP